MHKVSLGLAWSSFLLGAVGFWSYISGYQRSFELPDIPRPNVGPGFSESATAIFGGALIVWWFAAAGVLLGCVGIAFGKRRLFKLLLALPAFVYFIAPFVMVK